MTMIVVISLHDGPVARDLLPVVVPVNAPYARQAWRGHITRLLDEALECNGSVLDEVAAAMAPTSTIVGDALIHVARAGAAEPLVAAGHVPEVWGSANRGPAATSSSLLGAS